MPEKTLTIVVNASQYPWSEDTISYGQVVTLAVPDHAQHPEIIYSVKYTRGEGNKPEGILAPGATVKVKDGMVFSVQETGQS